VNPHVDVGACAIAEMDFFCIANLYAIAVRYTLYADMGFFCIANLYAIAVPYTLYADMGFFCIACDVGGYHCHGL
jgi:hypothetical protein